MRKMEGSRELYISPEIMLIAQSRNTEPTESKEQTTDTSSSESRQQTTDDRQQKAESSQ
jgi:hypothetical protein